MFFFPMIAFTWSGILLRGLAEGITKGRTEGRAEGKAEGLAEAQAEIARKMKALGVDIDTIVQATGLDRKTVESL